MAGGRVGPGRPILEEMRGIPRARGLASLPGRREKCGEPTVQRGRDSVIGEGRVCELGAGW